MGRIALLTCHELPEPDPDEALTLQAFRDAGHDARMVPWNGPERPTPQALGAYDLCILRSTWDYIWHTDAFDVFAEEAAQATRLCNPLQTVRWNLHKRYLSVLADAGLAVTPTLAVAMGESISAEVLDARAWGAVVVKPAVSASSFATRLFDESQRDEAIAFVHELAKERDVIVQPYIATVERGGERALVCIDGELTHGIVKAPRFKGDVEQVSRAFAPDDRDRAFVEAALASLPAELGRDLLYARVDVFDDGAGGLLLSELELIEPSLYFVQAPQALESFVRAAERRLS